MEGRLEKKEGRGERKKIRKEVRGKKIRKEDEERKSIFYYYYFS